jgi:hypothetical protein
MNRQIQVLAGALILLAQPALAAQTLREQSERVIEAQGVKLLRVENPRGLIRLGISGDDRIHLRALKLVRSSDRDRARDFARETQVSLVNEGGSCEVRVRYPQRHAVRIGFWEMLSSFEFPVTEVRLALDVPARLPVRLRSTSGDIETTGLQGPQDVESTSGDLVVTEATGGLRVATTSGDITVSTAGPVMLRTVSGDVTAEDLSGPLDAHTTSGQLVVRGGRDSLALATVSGDILVDRAPRGLRASTTSGDIRAHGVSGALLCSTSSGDVEAWLVTPLTRAEVMTGSGDIAVRIPHGLGCEIEMRTSNGSLETSMPLERTTYTRHLVTGRVGNGTVPVRLRTSSGDIHLLGGGN